MPSVLVGLDTQWFTSFNSFSDHSMSADEMRKTFILVVRGWHFIRSRAAMIFCLTTSLVAPISSFPVLQHPTHLHASSRSIALKVSPLIVNSGAGSCSLHFLSLSITNKYVFFTLICIPHQAENSCTTFSMPTGVSAKIEISSMDSMLLN